MSGSGQNARIRRDRAGRKRMLAGLLALGVIALITWVVVALIVVGAQLIAGVGLL